MPGFLFPTWPSPTFDRWALAQLDDLVPWSDHPGRYVAVVMLAITSRCALSCAHCSAAGELGPAEKVDLDRWIRLVARLQERGLMQLHLTGGDPMMRFDDVLTLLRSMRPDTDTWIDTSGVGLTRERAQALADAGLTGVVVSIDDWRPAAHDAFRGREGVFRHATAACRAAADAGLVVATSLVPPRGVTREFLDRYADLSTSLGAAFLRIVEPKATGRWAGQAVTLTPADRATVEAFERESNTSPALRDRPCVIDHDRVHRQIGCLTAGDRGFYIDTAGRAHGCPFCGHAGPDVLDGDLDEAIVALRGAGCERYVAARTFDRFARGRSDAG
jgi:MoaA/NifB/PqqE/SkfB family radical SAM enzyme